MKIFSKLPAAFVLLLFCGAASAQNLPAPAAAPTYNPMRAVHDVEVGKFYMKRGDIDGAIARFKDAMQYKPHYAEPCLQLGQAYEKKNDPATAVDYYQRYLKILPSTPESKKVRERIAKLEAKLEKEKSAAR
ncbi:MAG TPA: tetratricopeptide repeat protein [Candidatus Acidoferrales bacterium]|nr:tetratricopeptide repeat protein [Candidatus Acidoferrales bacterium]